MKTILRLAVLALAGTAVLAFAGNALATQKLSVKQTTTSPDSGSGMLASRENTVPVVDPIFDPAVAEALIV